MLYPKEQVLDDGKGKLIYECRICGNYEKARENDEHENCVYKSDHTKLQENMYVDTECVKDPTLSRSKDDPCTNCN